MARRRFFVDEVRRGYAQLDGANAQHLVRVLRVEAGQRFEISDNQNVYLAEVEVARKEQVRFKIVEELKAEVTPVRILLFVSLIKLDRFEWLLEKATELGVSDVFPVRSERSEKGLDTAAEKRLPRWRKIVFESSQQARRVRLPEVHAAMRLNQARVEGEGWRCFLDEKADAPPIFGEIPDTSAVNTVSVLAGPEGGWTEAERIDFVEAGWKRASLGARILRTETAAMAALAIVSNAWEIRKI